MSMITAARTAPAVKNMPAATINHAKLARPNPKTFLAITCLLQTLIYPSDVQNNEESFNHSCC
jgi:hypothetical protein